jgi:hypothetical protein
MDVRVHHAMTRIAGGAQAASLSLPAACLSALQRSTRDRSQGRISASCRDEQAGSLCSPDSAKTRKITRPCAGGIGPARIHDSASQ